MTPCEWCPYAGCACPWQGGVNPAAAEADTDAKRDDRNAPTWDNWDGNDERPTAPTVDRSSHSDSTQPKGRDGSMVATFGPQWPENA